MKLSRSTPTTAVLFALTTGVAEAKFAKGEIPAILEANEKKFHDALKNRDEKGFMALVDPDGLSVDPNGFAPVSVVPEMMKQIVIRSYSISGFKTLMVDKECHVAIYTWNGEATYKGQPYPGGPWYCSTVWAKRGGDWRAIYHQETLAMPAK